MSENKGDERTKMIREVTDDLLTSKFTSEVGQKAKVERHSLQTARSEQLREVISDVGRDLVETGTIPKGMGYVGSLCIHIYKSEILRTAAFATTSNVGELTFDLADAGLRELTGATLVQFGKQRRKLRSGF